MAKWGIPREPQRTNKLHRELTHSVVVAAVVSSVEVEVASFVVVVDVDVDVVGVVVGVDVESPCCCCCAHVSLGAGASAATNSNTRSWEGGEKMDSWKILFFSVADSLTLWDRAKSFIVAAAAAAAAAAMTLGEMTLGEVEEECDNATPR